MLKPGILGGFKKKSTAGALANLHKKLCSTLYTVLTLSILAKNWSIFLKNYEAAEQAKQLMPGGVNSPVRAFQQVQGLPPCIVRGEGPYLYDVEGRRYIDFIQSWGACIFGHGAPHIVHAIQKQLEQGISFGANSKLEIDFALELIKAMPSLKKIRLANSGTEATMTAVRLARGHTQRDFIVKFKGHYHGHSDVLLAQAGSGLATCALPSSLGVPHTATQHTLVIDFNDFEALEHVFQQHGASIAGIIVEPIAGNMNFVFPQEGFLKALRSYCDQYGSVLIFDEVMTGFRVAHGGAQALYEIEPDLTCLGKVIGGGLPLAALGGRTEIMDLLAPIGPVYQAGTMAGHPLALAAGLSALQHLSPALYADLEKSTARLIKGLSRLAALQGIPFQGHYKGGMFGFCFSDVEFFKKFFHAMLSRGVYFAPSTFEAGFISTVHDANLIDQTLEIAEGVFKQLNKI